MRREFVRDGGCVCVCACVHVRRMEEREEGRGGRTNVCRGVSAREKDEGRVTGEEDKCVRW